jgi:hypothetical protein
MNWEDELVRSLRIHKTSRTAGLAMDAQGEGPSGSLNLEALLAENEALKGELGVSSAIFPG